MLKSSTERTSLMFITDALVHKASIFLWLYVTGVGRARSQGTSGLKREQRSFFIVFLSPKSFFKK
jgi:hypothetical protein